MIIVQVVLLSLTYEFIFTNNKPLYVPLSTLIITLAYFAKKYLTSVIPSLAKTLAGELPHQLIYLAWLYLFPKDYLLYYLPLILSTAGKLYLMNIGTKDPEGQSKVEEVIMLQNKTELYILFTLFLSLFKF